MIHKNSSKILYSTVCVVIIAFVLNACVKDTLLQNDVAVNTATTTPYHLHIPGNLPPMAIPSNNPLTVEGIALGKKLFEDPILSANNKQACISCHSPAYFFTDSLRALSTGIDGIKGTRNAMALFNLGFQKKFFWDGGAADLESQVLGPIQNPVEMHSNLSDVINKLNAHKEYPALFKTIFGTSTISSNMLMKVIAQYERTLVSANSRYDKYIRGESGGVLTAQELHGMELFQDQDKGDCVHCHVLGSTFSDFDYKNNGLDSIAIDKGRFLITKDSIDMGKFKTPSLRNIAVTAPYMHDGRFATLHEVLDFYNTGFHYTTNLDPNLYFANKGRLTEQDIQDIMAFLNTLTDYEFITTHSK